MSAGGGFRLCRVEVFGFRRDVGYLCFECLRGGRVMCMRIDFEDVFGVY